jgi:hypothetical protein
MRLWRFRKPVADRTTAAAGYVAAAQRQFRHVGHYADVVAQLPLLLHQHGFGQTLSYLKLRSAGRAESPYSFVYDQLQEHLYEVFRWRGQDLLQVLTRMESERYLRLAIETYAFAEAWRRAVQMALHTGDQAQSPSHEEGGSL